MCGTHKFMNSVQVGQVAKGNNHRVQYVKYVSIINSDVTVSLSVILMHSVEINPYASAIPCQACGL